MMRFPRGTGNSKVIGEDVIRTKMLYLAYYYFTVLPDNGKPLITKAYLSLWFR